MLAGVRRNLVLWLLLGLTLVGFVALLALADSEDAGVGPQSTEEARRHALALANRAADEACAALAEPAEPELRSFSGQEGDATYRAKVLEIGPGRFRVLGRGYKQGATATVRVDVVRRGPAGGPYEVERGDARKVRRSSR